jgi:hypothetical protein
MQLHLEKMSIQKFCTARTLPLIFNLPLHNKSEDMSSSFRKTPFIRFVFFPYKCHMRVLIAAASREEVPVKFTSVFPS